MSDAVVVGAGPNGLVAANILAGAGWKVLVLEEQDRPGGAVKSGELTVPGFTHDLFSAFYPLAAASPVLASLDLHEHGLIWKRSPLVLAHPLPDGTCPVLSTDVHETAESFDHFAPGDGDRWKDLYGMWEAAGDRLLRTLLSPFPPFRAALGLASSLGPAGGIRFSRMAIQTVRRMVEEDFRGDAGMILAGNALHTDLTPESPGSALYGWLLTCLGQSVGFPVPEGGSGKLTEALVRRLRSLGGEIRCGEQVVEISIRGGRAEAVVTAGGSEFEAERAVLADVGAPTLYLDLVGPEHLSSLFLDQIRRFEYDSATIKVDWALNGAIPWKSDAARLAATLHISEGIDHMSRITSGIAQGIIPDRPFLVAGQMNIADPSRSPRGTETAWAYAHVPQVTRADAGGVLTGSWNESEGEIFADRMEGEIESLAPGFRDLIVHRHVFSPPKLEAADRNLVNGALNGGTAQLHQQLIFRPTPGMAGPKTPIAGLYLASASAHPGGGVHGACGANAARAALKEPKVAGLAAAGAGLLAAAVAMRRRR